MQVVVAAESPEDWQALRLLTTAVGLRLLAEQGIAREVPLFGKLQVLAPLTLALSNCHNNKCLRSRGSARAQAW